MLAWEYIYISFASFKFGKCIMGYEYFIYEVYARNFKCIFLAFDVSVTFDACARLTLVFLEAGTHLYSTDTLTRTHTH